MMTDDKTPPLPWWSSFRRIWRWVCGVPIVQYYTYMYKNNRRLFFTAIFTNYGLRLLLEAMPWWLSRTQLARLLRMLKNKIMHALVAGRVVPHSTLLKYVLLTAEYALLHTLDMFLFNRVALACRLLLKRLVLERVLYSEVGALQAKYAEEFGCELRTEELEARVFSDISLTLYLFNHILPTALGGVFSLWKQGWYLHENRAHIDIMAIVRPLVVGVVNEVIREVTVRAVEQQQQEAELRTNADMSRVVANVVDGLPEVQVNNLQESQLRQLDAIAAKDVSEQQGSSTFLSRTCRTVQNRNVLDFVSEVVVVSWVMRTRGIDHEEYSRLQNDIEYAIRLARRVWLQVRQGWDIVETQQRVMSLLDLPGFRDEQLPGIERIDSIALSRLRFSYPRAVDTVVLDVDVPLKFERGRAYAIVGKNRSGKSTLVKVLVRLLAPAEGDEDVVLNDEQPLRRTDRRCLRRRISYVGQRPFIFPGTVAENIRVGRPDASIADVRAAARLATIEDENIEALETLVGGSNLSGGLCQSVALARVFTRADADVVILDEAMGQMDAVKKCDVLLPRLFEFVRRHNMMLVVISHDVRSVGRLVDHVVVLDEGRVVQQGTHDELLQREGGVYARLVSE